MGTKWYNLVSFFMYQISVPLSVPPRLKMILQFQVITKKIHQHNEYIEVIVFDTSQHKISSILPSLQSGVLKMTIERMGLNNPFVCTPTKLSWASSITGKNSYIFYIGCISCAREVKYWYSRGIYKFHCKIIIFYMLNTIINTINNNVNCAKLNYEYKFGVKQVVKH